ncbi:PGR5-like protein 1B [Pyrus ussuriensis x Pyrus communis]|uniref:PGR5-like protein 1B n=1 Tax=Pyrus ussuriensis x Pyrus communis TaxID=2448454 RepID=A0A5N5FV36_9ROSA|nr:PGR5-like protein 1B, chloroplastic [Pyrus x bretschneideri]KAB2606923.1 PGR5-like protein 1B [Pyrus ussuriensis x Pyrus communis]
MAATSASFTPHLVGSTVPELARNPRSTGAPFSVRISSGSNYPTTRDNLSEGPYCIYVGPIETASKETLEALYRQARDAYYSGDPLIVDDMFDRVEMKLRWYGSKCVVKYPRCSLRRQSTYADAEEDFSQVFALASIWILFLAFGSSVCLVPVVYTVGLAYQDAFNPVFSYINQAPALSMLNSILFMILGSVIGYPIASASVKVLQGLWRNDLVALKGACPNCGDEVFAFVKSDQSNSPHRANCHVCECLLEFRTKVEKSISPLGRRWVHGRIYLVSRVGGSQPQRRL